MWILCLLLCALTASAEPQAVAIDKLTLEQKVGQMFMLGFRGTKITPELQTHLATYKPGALILFGRNIRTLTQTAELNAELQQISLRSTSLPLFLAIDQEGGGVMRIKTSPAMPSAYTIGNTNDPTLAFQAGKVTGEILSLLGFNMNLAPVLDITDTALTSFISTRSFSDSPHKISAMGIALAQGLAESKVMPVAKHFPGHGPIALDSHKMTPHRQISYSHLSAHDLVPFTQLSNTDVNSGIMVAHISYPQIDSSNMPATFSKKLVSDVLVEQLKYKGIIMTDDLEMSGAATLKRVEDRALAAIRAGNDLLLFGWSPPLQARAIRAVIQAVRAGKITEDRINRSVRKILSYKALYAANSLRAPASAVQMRDEMRKIQYNSVYSDIIARFFKELPGVSARGAEFQSYVVFSPTKAFLTSFRRLIGSSKIVEIQQSKKKVSVPNNALLVFHISNARSLTELKSLPENLRRRTVVVSSYSRSSLENKSSFLDVIEVHSNHPNLGGYLAEALNKAQRKVSYHDPSDY